MNKTIKIMSTIMMVMILCFSSTLVFAGGTGSAGQTGQDLSQYIKDPVADGDSATKISDIGSNIAGIIQVAGMSIAVIILIYIGIKYILGSAEDQANYKKSMIPYLIGAVILFLASFLVRVIYDFSISMQTT